ncbi:MAG: gamma-glutamyl-gamma-aminobutyrate hydrolase family protein [Anaerococcus sp.]|nr:gamma-glutamyl-gamma-aminobutyrate hydrolase family protein [Peptoniphilaceae bacterium]MDY3055497.1 gamma-glutamyl-gamma-aminobutyrate hydrolase family protein [Anaerococcus sp.]
MGKVLKFIKRILIVLIVILTCAFVYMNFVRQKNVAIICHDYRAANTFARSLTKGNVGISLFDLSDNDTDFYIDLLDQVDGVIFAGDKDFDPAIYGGGNRELLEDYDFAEDRKEIQILDAALEKDVPVLGICRGCQLINIYFGGSLYEDLPSQFSDEISHRNGKNDFSRHAVSLEPGSRFGRILNNENIEVNSYHHQGIRDLGDDLQVLAHSNDGLVEAIENPSYTYLVGIQWHPEIDSEDLVSEKIFKDFFKSL